MNRDEIKAGAVRLCEYLGPFLGCVGVAAAWTYLVTLPSRPANTSEVSSDSKRYEIIYKQNLDSENLVILRDKETDLQYLSFKNGLIVLPSEVKDSLE